MSFNTTFTQMTQRFIVLAQILNYMGKSMWKPRVLIWSWAPQLWLHSHGKPFHKISECVCGNLCIFNQKSIVRLGTDVDEQVSVAFSIPVHPKGHQNYVQVT